MASNTVHTGPVHLRSAGAAWQGGLKPSQLERASQPQFDKHVPETKHSFAAFAPVWKPRPENWPSLRSRCYANYRGLHFKVSRSNHKDK